MSCTLTSAPFANNIFTTSTWPFWLAFMSAVLPLKKKKKKNIYLFKNKKPKKQKRKTGYTNTHIKKIFDLKKSQKPQKKKKQQQQISILILILSNPC